MAKKIIGGVATTILSVALGIFEKVAEMKEWITKANADTFLILAIVLFVIGIGLLLWAFWPLIIKMVFHKNQGTQMDSKSCQPIIGIDAEESFINARGARIKNQDIGVKSKKSIIDMPNSEIRDERKTKNR